MARAWRWAAFDALGDRNFRWLWLGSLASSATFQIGGVAQGWLVYDLTSSAFALGWVGSGWSLSALLLSPYGGALADRVEKRDLLIWARLAMALSNLAIALLISAGVLRLWHLAAGSLLQGVCFAFMMPAGQAIISDLVGPDALLNAVSLNSVGMGLMGILAASLAGYLVQVTGPAGAYYLMVGCYLVAVFAMTRLPRLGSGVRDPTSIWADLREGVRYIRSESVLLAVIGAALIEALLVMPYRTLMPKFAQEVMHMDASGLGVLMAAPGVGALASSLATASLVDFRGKGKLLLASGLVLGGGLLFFANIPVLVPILLFLSLVGAADNACMVFTSTLLQTHSHEHLRGRVMSVYMMIWGLVPLATLPAGVIADRLGVTVSVSLEGALLIVLFLGVRLWWPHLGRLE
jgi:MFS family permease